ncbi:MAG: bifunctional NADH-specific enoyl-ACP reductase/trans-2-enoyl-CoA reductase, partial [Puniceicoccales bacterium]|nr:bifunctional NADH-specific enoyl-ACP reductase/trans-2-enoyl-CoA reductase [Puniceicoccales bacterium]
MSLKQIVRPKIRSFICVTAHPAGCAAHVQGQIDYIKQHPPLKDPPRSALIIGASTGYGLATRIALAYGAHTPTLGIFYEKPSENGRPASPGWYNTAAFETQAR